MVITFEEEQGNPAIKYLIIVVVVAIIGAAGFFGYQYFKNLNDQVDKTAIPTQVMINWASLKDEKLDKLELFPSVSPSEGDIGKENPFN